MVVRTHSDYRWKIFLFQRPSEVTSGKRHQRRQPRKSLKGSWVRWNASREGPLCDRGIGGERKEVNLRNSCQVAPETIRARIEGKRNLFAKLELDSAQ